MELITKQCDVCGYEWQCSVGTDAPCGNCELASLVRLFRTLSPELTAEIDELIYQRRIVEGMRKLKESLPINLKQSNELFGARYDELRALETNKFICSESSYWNGFYS